MTRTETADLLSAYARASVSDRHQIRQTLAALFEELPPANVTIEGRTEILAALDRFDTITEAGAN